LIKKHLQNSPFLGPKNDPQKNTLKNDLKNGPKMALFWELPKRRHSEKLFFRAKIGLLFAKKHHL
jgi:hypothetical protein